jgi:signal peptidase II
MNQVPSNRYWCFGLLVTGALGWDLLSKEWVFRTLGFPGRNGNWSVEFPLFWGRFSMKLTTWFNQGALFGIGQGMGWLFATLSIFAAAGIIYYLFVTGGAASWWMTVTLALILAGAMGNLYDRLWLHGCVNAATGAPYYGVRDFFQCDIPLIGYRWQFPFYLIPRYNWPIFNFADTYLVAGAIMLTLYSLLAPQPQKEAAAGARASSGTATPLQPALHA